MCLIRAVTGGRCQVWCSQLHLILGNAYPREDKRLAQLGTFAIRPPSGSTAFTKFQWSLCFRTEQTCQQPEYVTGAGRAFCSQRVRTIFPWCSLRSLDPSPSGSTATRSSDADLGTRIDNPELVTSDTSPRYHISNEITWLHNSDDSPASSDVPDVRSPRASQQGTQARYCRCPARDAAPRRRTSSPRPSRSQRPACAARAPAGRHAAPC